MRYKGTNIQLGTSNVAMQSDTSSWPTCENRLSEGFAKKDAKGIVTLLRESWPKPRKGILNNRHVR